MNCIVQYYVFVYVCKVYCMFVRMNVCMCVLFTCVLRGDNIDYY